MRPFLLLHTGLVLGLSFWLGFLVNRASSCGVAAVRHWREHGRLDRILGLILAAGGAAVAIEILQPLSAASPGSQPSLPLALVIAGAIAVGAGAVLNGACLLGSLSRLGDGEVRFLLILPGLAAGFWAAEGLRPALEHVLASSPSIANPPLDASMRIGVMILLGSAIWLFWPWARHDDPRHWPLRWAMPLLGGIGGALYCLFPGWSYADAIHSAVHAAVRMSDLLPPAMSLACIALLAAGAMASGMGGGRRGLLAPDARSSLRSLSGAFLMGLGGAFAGGGNDHLLLWSLPHLLPSALLAYLFMTATITLLIWFGQPADPAQMNPQGNPAP